MKYIINWLSNPEPVSLMTFLSPVIMLAVMFIGFACFNLS